jgi:hypothetical protein
VINGEALAADVDNTIKLAMTPALILVVVLSLQNPRLRPLSANDAVPPHFSSHEL